jgi:hypothetical protein
VSRKTAVTGLRIEVDPPHHLSYWGGIEKQERQWKAWAREFEAFVRDHRSQDAVSLSVIRDTEDQCEHCGSAWTEASATYNGGCCQKDMDAEDARLAGAA